MPGLALAGACFQGIDPPPQPDPLSEAAPGSISSDTGETGDASGNASGPAPPDGGGTGGPGGGSSDPPATTGEDPIPTTSGAVGDGSSGGGTSVGDGPTPDEAELIELVNAYRMDNGLPAIPVSPSLTVVAQAHAQDLADHAPHAPANCNLHSWSNQGPWSACCYTADHAQAQCMWDKPDELTTYSGNGYENAASGVGSPASALSLWQNSSGHNAVILNQGTWSSYPWGAVGAGMHAGFAVLWFGVQSD